MQAMGLSFFLEQAGILGFGGAIHMGGDLKEAEAALLAEIKDLTKNGVTEKEVQKARNNLVAQSVTQRMTVSGKSQRLGHAAVVMGKVEIVNQELDMLMKVTKEDVDDVIKKYMKDQRRMTLTVTPAIQKLNPFRGLFKKSKKASKDENPRKKEQTHHEKN